MWLATLGPVLVALFAVFAMQRDCTEADFGTAFETLFRQQIDRRLDVPLQAQQDYARILTDALAEDGIAALTPQLVILVDRNPNVQALVLFWKPWRRFPLYRRITSLHRQAGSL